jgi:hypothetical protein
MLLSGHRAQQGIQPDPRDSPVCLFGLARRGPVNLDVRRLRHGFGMSKRNEKDLDKALDVALSSDPTFASWFLSHTKFADLNAEYEWSRADNPWGTFSLPVECSETGECGAIIRQGETDVLVVFKASDGRRVALHIENKLAKGKFTPFQLALYNTRARAWKGNAAYGNYDDWEVVLLAPRVFYNRFPELCAKFGKYIAHEDIAKYLPIFGTTS